MGREMSGPPTLRRTEAADAAQWGGAQRSRARSARVPFH